MHVETAALWTLSMAAVRFGEYMVVGQPSWIFNIILFIIWFFGLLGTVEDTD